MPRKAKFVGLPFYIFLSILLGVLAVSGTRVVTRSASLAVGIVYILLFGIHIGLYWLNLKQFQNRRWFAFYYLLQAGLIVVLISFPYGGDRIRGSILGSAVLCMIGEVLGIWGNTRRSLVLGLFYAGLLLVLLFVVVGRAAFWSAVSGLLINGTLLVLFMIVLNQQFAEREKAEELPESLESANAKLAASAARIESLTLQNERQRMARELHDTLAQGLAGLVLQLEAVKAHLASSHTERATAIVEQALGRARSTLEESRAAIDGLRAGPADLAMSIREKVDRFTQATGIPCELDMTLQASGLSTEVAVHVLSVLSESLMNVTRHAKATRVNVRFNAGKDGLELEVSDNGKGFDADREIEAGHYGLLGMRERARLIGGELIVKSEAGQGTKVRFVLHNLPNGAKG